ncbi:MAG: class I SAM-dependent methyltransferase [Chloroflexi bacterium]|nr:class I SAM-dependent methyltransferase [Chloroflexota bacterium]
MSNHRANSILASFASEIAPHARILDIGAGKGWLAQAMARQLVARVTMVDVASYNQSDLPLTICDSRALAFADDSFDFAVLSFVLHHTPKPETILREALRVARAAIVIENDVRGVARQWLTRAIDSYPALRYGTPPCYIAQPRAKWMQFFAQFPVEARVLSEFRLERGFFRNFTVVLRPQTADYRPQNIAAVSGQLSAVEI